MQARHGGKANNDKSAAQKMAVLLRGGRRPHAYVSPAERRATRARLRRRVQRMRKRAERLTPIPQTNRQYNWPARGKKSASKANRTGVAERFPAPAVPQSIEGDLALIGPDDSRLRDRELSSLKTAQQYEATTLSLLRTVPGIGEMLRPGAVG